MKRLALAFGQVRVAGRLTGGDLLQFTAAGVPMIKNLAEVMGKGEDEIKEMIEAGKVGSNDVVKAFNNMTKEGGIFGGMMDEMSRTVKGRWNALTETFEVGVRDFGNAMLEGFRVGEVLEGLTELMGEVRSATKDLKPFFAQLREGADVIWGLIKGFRDWVVTNQEVITKVLIVIGLVVALKGAFMAVGFAISIATGLLTTFLWLLGGLAVAIALVSSPIGAIGLALIAVGKMVWGEFGQPITDAVNSVFGTFGKLADDLKGTFETAFKGIRDALKAGDMELVGKIMTQALYVAWVSLVARLKEVWVDFKLWSQTQFTDIGYAIDVQLVEANRKLSNAAIEATGVFNSKATVDEKLAKSNADFDRKIAEVHRAQARATDLNRGGAGEEKHALQAPVREARAELERLGLAASAAADAMYSYKNYQIEFVKASYDAEKMAKAVTFSPEARAATKNAGMNPEQVQGLRTGIDLAMRTAMGGTDPTKFLAGPMSEEQFNFRPKAAGTKADPSQSPLDNVVGAEARTIAMQVKSEMLKGTGPMNDPLVLFNKNMVALKEARDGKLGQSFAPLFDQMGDSFGGAFSGLQTAPDGKGLGGVLNEKQYQFGIGEQFANLQKSVKLNPFAQPAAEYRGTAQAQDAINAAKLRNEDGAKSPEERIIEYMRVAQEMEKQAQEVRRRTAEALEKLAGSSGAIVIGDFGGGGDF